MHLKQPSVEVVPDKIIKRTVKKVKTYKQGKDKQKMGTKTQKNIHYEMHKIFG